MAPKAEGDRAFVAAHGIATTSGLLPFEEAYPLAKLVIHDGGGPVPVGKRTFVKKTARALQEKGWVTLHGIVPDAVQFVIETEVVYDEVEDRNRTIRRAKALKASGARARMWVQATQDGVDLITKHLPK